MSIRHNKPAALKVFTVNYCGIRIKVRLLPTVADVHREYTKGMRRRDGKIVHAFYSPMRSPAAKYAGTMVLPIDGDLQELIPHETVHAVMDKIGGAHCTDDESLATAVGVLSARISRKVGQWAERGLVS